MKNIKIILSFFVVIGFFLMACEPKIESGLELGPLPTVDQLSMTIEPGTDAYHWILKNNSSTTGIAYWDLGNGKTAKGNEIEVHYPDVNMYTIKMTLVTSGGSISKSMEHEQTVPDPIAGNLVKGGKFLTQDDFDQWTIQKINNFDGNWELKDGWAFIDNVPGSWGQQAFYQPIEVIANQQYKVDLKFKTDGVKNGWFKVYACTTQPTQGVEYTGEILITEVGIWGDPVPAKSGLLSAIHNPDSGLKSNCIVSFATSGTIWLQIQCGGEDLKNGVSVTNIEFRGYNP